VPWYEQRKGRESEAAEGYPLLSDAYTMREWCARAEFRALLPQLLEGEDADVAAYLRRLAAETDTRRAAGRA
jgi:hypothetical protein